LAQSIELTEKPTYLDRMQDPDLFDEEMDGSNNPDTKHEPSCSIVMAKCCGELLSIMLYVLMTLLLIIGILEQTKFGKPISCFVQFGIALCID
jgi:hypothetical protein